MHVSILSLTLISTLALAHPGHVGLDHEIAERNAYFKHAPRNLDHCAAKLRERGVHDNALKRRMATVQNLRREVQLKKRSLESRQGPPSATGTFPSGTAAMPSGSGAPPSNGNGSAPDGTTRQNISEYGSQVLNTSHLSTLSVTPNATDVEELIFSGNNSCILNPEGEVGPYYVSGEYVRSNVTESQAGILLYLDQQFINTQTCDPISSLYADIWHCNATGVYAGVVANGNGDTSDASNLNATFLRGVQSTDDQGVASWLTIFPGYYQGRTTHIHMVTHMGSTELANGTISGGNVTHIGQLFFDQDLIDSVNSDIEPYNTNDAVVTDNEEDSVFIAETTTTGSDPVVNYVLLGDSVEDGIFAWITIGVDPDARYNATAAAVLGADGGHETGNSQPGKRSEARGEDCDSWYCKLF